MSDYTTAYTDVTQQIGRGIYNWLHHTKVTQHGLDIFLSIHPGMNSNEFHELSTDLYWEMKAYDWIDSDHQNDIWDWAVLEAHSLYHNNMTVAEYLTLTEDLDDDTA